MEIISYHFSTVKCESVVLKPKSLLMFTEDYFSSQGDDFITFYMGLLDLHMLKVVFVCVCQFPPFLKYCIGGFSIWMAD